MIKLLYLILLTFVFISCVDKPIEYENINENPKVEGKENISEEKAITGNHVGTEWLLYTVSESPIVNTNTKTRGEIINEFETVKIEINDTYFTVGSLCTFELYKTIRTPLEHFSRQNTINTFTKELSKKGINLTDKLIVYQALYPEKLCENPASEYFITDSTLVFSYNGYLVLFQQITKLNASLKSLNETCYSNTKFKDLPITKGKSNTEIWNELGCSISNLNSNMYIRLPDIVNVKVFIIGDFNSDDFFYTLITIKDNKIITQLEIGFAEESDDNKGGREVVEFEISKDYIFTITTMKQDNAVWKTEQVQKGKIDESDKFNIIL